jgi:hypothetical protein
MNWKSIRDNGFIVQLPPVSLKVMHSPYRVRYWYCTYLGEEEQKDIILSTLYNRNFPFILLISSMAFFLQHAKS